MIGGNPKPSDPDPSDDGRVLQEFVKELTAGQTRLHAFIVTLMPGSPDVGDVLQKTNLTPGSPTIRVVATIGSDEAEGGKLFGHLQGIENSGL